MSLARGRPDLKLSRASELIAELRRSIDDYRGTGFQVVATLDEADHAVDFSLHVHEAPPLDQWALIFADCIHNIRAALDQLAWQLDPTPEAGAGGTTFPIFTNAPKKWPPGSVARMPAEAQAIIQRLQPYHAIATAAAGEQAAEHFLAVIQELDNSDKHRVLLVPSTTVHGDRIAGLPFGASTEGPVFANFIDGAYVMRVRLPRDLPLTLPLRCDLFVEPRLAEYPGVSMLTVLDELYGRVRGYAYEPLMPYARP